MVGGAGRSGEYLVVADARRIGGRADAGRIEGRAGAGRILRGALAGTENADFDGKKDEVRAGVAERYGGIGGR